MKLKLVSRVFKWMHSFKHAQFKHEGNQYFINLVIPKQR